MNAEDIDGLLGKPWEGRSCGPNSFDCWGLVRYVYQKYLNIELKDYLDTNPSHFSEYKEMMTSESNQLWKLVKIPKNYTVVAMSINKNYVHHAGIYLDLDDGVILHCKKGPGVICEKLSDARSKYELVKFYELRSRNTKCI